VTTPQLSFPCCHQVPRADIAGAIVDKIVPAMQRTSVVD
jgi:hypothetical protein